MSSKPPSTHTIDPDRRVLVAMSGGVDSSVAACLLAEQGYQVVGIFMALVKADGYSGCCSISDRRDAEAVALQHGFKFAALNYQEHFDDLKSYFVDEYDRGRTPNPCVRCNSELKFGELLSLADRLRCRWIATGHYARIVDGAIHRAVDPGKDQSYVLATIDRRVLPRLKLPVGGYTKDEIRHLAGERFGLSLAAKPDSQDLCFVKHDYREVLEASGRLTPGPIITTAGRQIGEHAGFQRYTIGQRKGLGIGGGTIYRVVAIDAERAAVIVSANPGDLESRHVRLDGVNWLTPGTVGTPDAAVEATIQTRYQGACVAGLVHPDGSIDLLVPASGVTPGQLAAFYDGDRLLGGGFIARADATRVIAATT
jgi:tRNA-specific 2-thiouridylase